VSKACLAAAVILVALSGLTSALAQTSPQSAPQSGLRTWENPPRLPLPRSAIRAGWSEGFVELECAVGDDRRPKDCRVLAERPEDFGLGRNARRQTSRALLTEGAAELMRLEGDFRFTIRTRVE
jgi:hypothetical protein